jgi:hypothetical protein
MSTEHIDPALANFVSDIRAYCEPVVATWVDKLIAAGRPFVVMESEYGPAMREAADDVTLFLPPGVTIYAGWEGRR